MAYILGRGKGAAGGGGGAPSGPAGGDLGGTYPNPDVATVDNNVLGSGTPTAGTFLRGDRSWATPGLLALKVHAPAVQATYSTASATLADVDATNAVVTFTAPASGNVIVRVSAFMDSVASAESFIGLRESTTDLVGSVTRVQRGTPTGQYTSVPMYLSGISAGSHTYKLSFAVTTTNPFRIIVQDGSVATTKWGPLIIEVLAAP